MSAITLQNVSFGYTNDLIFDDLTLTISDTWHLGLIGRNGRGKTTLLRLIAGALTPSAGRIGLPGPVGYFPYPLDPALPALDALRGAVAFDDWEIRRELGLLDVSPDALERPVSTLSGGERTKLMLAALLAREERFLLIDEPTNHLDVHGRRLVGDYLARKRGFVLVSHDRAFLDRSVDHILSINKTGMVTEQGNYSSFIHNQKLRDAFEIERNEKLEKEIGALEDSQRNKRAWSDTIEAGKIGGHTADRGRVGHLAAKAMKRALSIQTRQQRMIDEKKELLKDLEYASELKIAPLAHDKRVLVSARDLALGYDGRAVVTGLSFDLSRGERLAVFGKNGCGKSTLLKAILGEIEPLQGELALAPRMVISSIAQETSSLKGDVRGFALSRGVPLTPFLTLLRKLDFRRDAFDQAIPSMSEGQKKKLLIAASLVTPAHLYVWDEPLNFIDAPSREQIENLIAGTEMTLLIVEHDETFLHNIGARVLEMGTGDGGVAGDGGGSAPRTPAGGRPPDPIVRR